MKRRGSYWGIATCLGILIAFAPAALGGAPPNRADTPQAKDSDYVGAEVCKTCHEDIYNGGKNLPIGRRLWTLKAGPSHQGCEGCHGPGAAHVAGGGDKSKIFLFRSIPPRKSRIDASRATLHPPSI